MLKDTWGVARNFLCHNVLAIFKVVVLPTLKMAKCLIVTLLRATPCVIFTPHPILIQVPLG